MVGLSQRTSEKAVNELAEIIKPFGYKLRIARTPKNILHFKSHCSLLDERTVISTSSLARSGCFDEFDVVVAPEVDHCLHRLLDLVRAEAQIASDPLVVHVAAVLAEHHLFNPVGEGPAGCLTGLDANAQRSGAVGGSDLVDERGEFVERGRHAVASIRER